MTGWIPDVVPDETIESAWGNEIRDRTVTPFTNAAERDASIPAPNEGMTVWLIDQAVTQIYHAGSWRTLAAWPRYSIAINAGTIANTLTGVTGLLVVPNLPYPHRLFVTASVVYTNVGSTAGSVLEQQVQYDLTGATPAAGAPSLRTMRVAVPIANSAATGICVGYLDRASGGTTGLVVRAFMSSGNATTDPSRSGFDVIAQPM
ncbi:MAG TPA: hypothetical protein VKB59_22740 [Micromonosporaceae bacterium]|nr:hypothetical protein [Micromonosporaceae bacterium]